MSEEKKNPPRAQIFRYFPIESRNKKGQNLIIHRFMFRTKINENFIYFKCCEINCSSRVTITGDSNSVIKKPGEHNQLPPDEKIQQENFRKIMIQRVEQNVSRSLKKSYDEAIQGTSEDFLPPKYEKIRKSMSRKSAEVLPELRMHKNVKTWKLRVHGEKEKM